MSTRDPRMLRTQFALQASDLASGFNASIGRMRIAPCNYTPELTAPEGPSTGGGAQALQHIRLVPQYAQQPTLVVGTANQKEGTAELRSYEHVDAVHRQRFKRPVMLDRAQYDQFLQQAGNFLQAVRLRVTIAGPPADLSAMASSGGDAARAPAPSSNRGLLIALIVIAVILLLVVIAAVLFFFLYWRARTVTP